MVTPACVKRMRKSTETSASTATIRIKAKEGSTPRTLRIAGIDMIPEPIMLVATLNTAPGIEPGTAAGFDPVKRGTLTPADGVGDIRAVRFFGEFEKGNECGVPYVQNTIYVTILFMNFVY